MPNLRAALSSLDPGFLTIMADFWGVEAKDENQPALVNQLAVQMSDAAQFEEMMDGIPERAKKAMSELARHLGKIPWVEFCRRFGNLSEAGQAKIEREKRYLQKDSATELLWYRGLLFRAFFEGDHEPLEYAYLPDEFMELMKMPSLADTAPVFGKPYKDLAKLKIIPATSQILDHACTLLAALRTGLNLEESCRFNIPIRILLVLLSAAGIVDGSHQPKTEQTRHFLEAKRSQALTQLLQAWEKSETINELWLMEEIKCEGKWRNRPQPARNHLLDLIKKIPSQDWWDLDAFIRDIHQFQPDFLRPSGDYDSWIIRSLSSGEYLRGFIHWDKVEGRFIRSILTMWLHWMGMTELAYTPDNGTVRAFRLSSWSKYLLNHQEIPNLPKETEKIIVRSNGAILCPLLTPRAVRYQIARFCEWGEEKKSEYQYFLSASSLGRAEKQQLHIDQLDHLIKKHARTPIPPSFLKALARWGKNHLQVKLQASVVLKVSDASILDELEKGRTKRFIVERVSPQLMLIRPGGEKVIQRALMEIGYLSDDQTSL